MAIKISVQKPKWSSQYTQVPSQDETEEISHKPRYLGIIFAILGALCFYTSMIMIKYLQDYETSEIIIYRLSIDIVLLLPFLIRKRIKFTFGVQPWNLIFRGILLAIAYFSNIFAIKRLPISEVTAITFCAPIMTAVISRIMLKNLFSNVKFIALLTNISGILLVTHLWTGLDTNRSLGISFAFLYVMSISVSNVILKKMSLDIEPQMIVFHMAWMRFCYMLIFTEVSNNFTVPRIPRCDYGTSFVSESVLIGGVAIFFLGFNLFNGEAMKLESPTTVTAINTSIQLPMFIISQWLIFNNAPSASVVIGVFAVLLTSWIVNVDTIANKLSSQSRLKRWIDGINRGFSQC